MRVTFDPAQNARTIAERALSFERVMDFDWETAVAVEDDRKDYGERRLRVMALLGSAATCRRHHLSRRDNARDQLPQGEFERDQALCRRKNNAASRLDNENPEWSREDFRRARPALAVIGETFGPEASQAVAQRRGRPRKASPKINQTLRLDADVVEAYRRQGRGWQTRINAVLRAHMNDRGK